jgi:hypothetical protein
MAGVVGQAFLGKHTDLQVDRPLVLRDEPLHAVIAAQADARIDLDVGAHARGPERDAVLQRLLGPSVDVLDGERVLHLRHALHRHRLPPGFRRAAVDDARLVEMNVRLDEPARGEAAAGVVGGTVGRDLGLDGGDPALLEADVDAAIADAGIPDDLVEHGGFRARHFGCGVGRRGRARARQRDDRRIRTGGRRRRA